jgi:predicted kinase
LSAKHLIHLICGSTGAGKTTYARELCARIGAVHFSIDEWMAALFWMDNPAPTDPAWAMERVERCMSQIWTVARQVAAQGVPCVLDFGFGMKDLRTRFAKLAREAGLSVQLHVLNVPADERWRRVQTRNQSGDAALAFSISREMFDFVETMWQPPTDAEMAACDGVRVAAPKVD